MRSVTPARTTHRGGRSALGATLLVLSLVLALAGTVVGCARSAPAAPAAQAWTRPAESAQVRYLSSAARSNITFYAAYDNDPPGSREIAYPNERHREAGGTGTFDDPTTLATDPRELAPGTVIYYPPLRRYFVMEDDCAECIDDWQRSRRPRLDLWTSAAAEKGVLDCEEELTPDGLVTVEINPPPGRPVDTRPLYSGGRCRSSG
ncbi:MAG TPA: hypothetical protein VGH99_17240 [Pseudonocardia sp.]|jgi:hypothetical protein